MPSPVESLAARLNGGRAAFTAWCGLAEPAIAGYLAREPFDSVVLDMQHGVMDFLTASRAIPLVTAAGKPALGRIPVGDFTTASRLLDAGASGIIAPMINTVEEARRFAAFSKFPPQGERSWGPLPALALTGLSAPQYFHWANDFIVTFAMIETREALDNLDPILAVDGIDGIFIGPSDLSIGLSGGRTLAPESPEVTHAVDHALARAKAAGKLAGIFALSGERAAEFASRGYNFIALGTDVGFLRTGALAMIRAAQGKAST